MGISPAAILYDATGQHAVGVVLDGTVYRLQSVGKLLNAAGSQVNPATEDTLGTRASQSTLSAADTKLGTIDGVLDSIKDTDGIKKIAEELPAGTQEIGSVKQGTKATGSGAWPHVLYDAAGNVVRVLNDGGVYRLSIDSKAAAGGATQKVQITDDGDVNIADLEDLDIHRLGTTARLTDGTNLQTLIEDPEEASQWRAQTESRLAPGSQVNIGTGIPSDPSDLVLDFCKNGGSGNLLVDGTTPVTFAFSADATKDLAIQELMLVFTADDFDFDGVSFGSIVALINGIIIRTIVGATTTDIFTLRQNEDFLRIPGRPPIVNNTGPKDVLAASFGFGGLLKLTAASSDKIEVIVQDDLGSVKLKYFTATVFAAKV